MGREIGRSEAADTHRVVTDGVEGGARSTQGQGRGQGRGQAKLEGQSEGARGLRVVWRVLLLAQHRADVPCPRAMSTDDEAT